MAASKRVELTDRLISKTERGELDWQETANPEAFQVAFPNYSLIISTEEKRGQAEVDYVITLVNSSGNKIDQFSDVELYEETNTPYFPKMKNLYDSARRKAVRADEAIDDILKELGDI